MHRALGLMFVISLCLLLASRADEAAPAVPAAPDRSAAGPSTPLVLDLEWADAARGLTVPVRIWYPENRADPAPVIVFSHGLGGSRLNYGVWGKHWASWGYVVCHVHHIGSDDEVWRQAGGPVRGRLALSRAAVDRANLVNRPLDMSFALDQLTVLNTVDGPLRGKLDLSRAGAAGHSFGAYTALAALGLKPPRLYQAWGGADERFRAGIAMSTPRTAPYIPDDQDALRNAIFADIGAPVLHLTGDLDISPIGNTIAIDRRESFDRTPTPGTALMNFTEADHMVFSGQRRRGTRAVDEAILDQCRALTVAFWDAWLRDDEAARTWFYGGAAAAATAGLGRLEVK